MLPASLLFNFVAVRDDRKSLLHLCCGWKEMSAEGCVRVRSAVLLSLTRPYGCHETASVNSGEASGSSQPLIPDTAQFENLNGDCGLFWPIDVKVPVVFFSAFSSIFMSLWNAFMLSSEWGRKGKQFYMCFSFFFSRFLIGWLLFLVFIQRKPISLSVRAGVLEEKEPYCLMKKNVEVFKVMRIEKEVIGYALPCVILAAVSGIKDILLLIWTPTCGCKKDGKKSSPVTVLCQFPLSSILFLISAWPFFIVKAGGCYHKVLHKRQPFVDAYMLNYNTPLIAAILNLSMSPPLLFYLVINHFMSDHIQLASSICAMLAEAFCFYYWF